MKVFIAVDLEGVAGKEDEQIHAPGFESLDPVPDQDLVLAWLDDALAEEEAAGAGDLALSWPRRRSEQRICAAALDSRSPHRPTHPIWHRSDGAPPGPVSSTDTKSYVIRPVMFHSSLI